MCLFGVTKQQSSEWTPRDYHVGSSAVTHVTDVFTLSFSNKTVLKIGEVKKEAKKNSKLLAGLNLFTLKHGKDQKEWFRNPLNGNILVV